MAAEGTAAGRCEKLGLKEEHRSVNIEYNTKFMQCQYINMKYGDLHKPEVSQYNNLRW